MPIRDKGTGTEDNNICFSNKPVTVRIWGWSPRQHWGPDAALQLLKQLALNHFSESLSSSQRLPACFILTRFAGEAGCSLCSAGSSLPLCLLFICVVGGPPFQEEPGSHKPSQLSPAFSRLGPRCGSWPTPRSVVQTALAQEFEDPAPHPSLASGSATSGG